MNQTELSKALRGSAGDRCFITATQLARALGQTNVGRVKKKYLEGLERIGNYYFIPDVSKRILEERQI